MTGAAPSPIARVARDGRTVVFRSGPGEPRWELWRRAPHPALGDLVAGLWAGAVEDSGARHRVLPNGELLLMFHLGPPQRAVETDGQRADARLGAGFVAGLQEKPFTIESGHRATRVVAARLRPAGVPALFPGVTAAEACGRVVDLEGALGRATLAEEVSGRMGDAADLGAALDVLEAWLLASLGARERAHPVTCAARDLIEASGGRARIAAVGAALGVSPRRMNELFQRDLGMPAKRFARVSRFRRALEKLAAAPAQGLARIALDTGYADEAHLCRDFRELALLTPRAYLDAHGGGLDGPEVVEGPPILPRRARGAA